MLTFYILAIGENSDKSLLTTFLSGALKNNILSSPAPKNGYFST